MVFDVVFYPIQHDQRGVVADESIALAVVDDLFGVRMLLLFELGEYTLRVDEISYWNLP